MNPTKYKKASWEVQKLLFDCTSSLVEGDSIASIDSVSVFDSSGKDVTSTIISGSPQLLDNSILVVVQAGSNGSTYKMRLRVVTAEGNKIEDSLKITVVDT